MDPKIHLTSKRLGNLILGMAEKHLDEAALNLISYRPTLIILLGGTGTKIGVRFKKFLQWMFKKEHLGAFQIVAFDTDEQDPPAGFEPLEAGEFNFFPPVDIAGQVQNIQANPLIAAWYPGAAEGRAHAVTHSGTGAHRDRVVGRLVMFNNMNKIHNALQAALNRATQINPNVGANRQSIKIYVVASLAGGTGSSMLIDTCYLARMLANQKAQGDVHVTGILVDETPFLPIADSPMSQMELKANVMASLLELNHCAATRKFDATYSTALDTTPLPDMYSPMDITYLVGLGNEYGQSLENADELYEMCAAQMVMEIISPVKRGQTAAIDNLRGQQNDVAGQPAFLSSFGIGTLQFPLEAVSMLGGVRAYSEVAKAVLLNPRFTSDELEADVLNFTQEAGIETTQVELLYEQLARDKQNQPLPDATVSHDLVASLPENQLLGRLQGLKTSANHTVAANREAIAARTAPFNRMFENSLRAKTQAILKDPRLGPAYTATFLRKLAENLQAQLDTKVTPEQTNCQADLSASQQEADDQFDHLTKALRLSAVNPLRGQRIKTGRLAFTAAFNASLNAAQNLEVRTQAATCLAAAVKAAEAMYSQAARLLEEWNSAADEIEKESETDWVEERATQTSYSLVRGVLTPAELERLCSEHFPALATPADLENHARAFWEFFAQANPGWTLQSYRSREAVDGPIVQLFEYLTAHYRDALRGTTLLQYLRHIYGEKWEDVISDLSEQSVPFWNYSQALFANEIQANLQKEPRIVGYGEDATGWGSDIVRITGQVQLANNQNIHEMVFCNTAHGLPLFALAAVRNSWWKAYQTLLAQWKNRKRHNRALPLHTTEQWQTELIDFNPEMPASTVQPFIKPNLAAGSNGQKSTSETPLAA